LTATAVIVFLGETIVMLTLDGVPIPIHAAPMIDAALLTLLIFPALHFVLRRSVIHESGQDHKTASPLRPEMAQLDGHLTPRFIFLKTGLSVFAAEVIVMLALDGVRISSGIVPFIDAALLTLLSFPALYYVLFRPIDRAAAQYRLTFGKLQETTEQLTKAALDWRVTFDSVESPMLVLDVDGRVHRLNRAAKELASKPYYALVGESVASVGPGGGRGLWPALAGVVQELRETRAPVTRQLDDPSNGQTWDIAASLATDPEVEEDRVTVVARDVTHITKLQASLRRTENMAAMGALVVGVAHEVRNPLFGMLATLDALEVHLETSGDGNRYLEVLRQEAGRLTELMQDLMDYGRPVDLNVTNGSVGVVINDSVKACEPTAREANVELVSTVAEQRVQVQGDVRCLRQVFHNLIMNAIQFSPSPGIVEVEARDIRRADGTWVQCAVRDAGTGIEAADMSRIFQPFFTKRAGGNGLGLSIVQRIVEQHGGTIWAENRPAGGAALMLRLPSAPFNHSDA
jgi:signal transduction histidine kinase